MYAVREKGKRLMQMYAVYYFDTRTQIRLDKSSSQDTNQSCPKLDGESPGRLTRADTGGKAPIREALAAGGRQDEGIRKELLVWGGGAGRSELGTNQATISTRQGS